MQITLDEETLNKIAKDITGRITRNLVYKELEDTVASMLGDKLKRESVEMYVRLCSDETIRKDYGKLVTQESQRLLNEYLSSDEFKLLLAERVKLAVNDLSKFTVMLQN